MTSSRRPHHHRPTSHRRAFTLPEVLASLVLVGIALPAAMKGLSLSMAAADDARRKVEATALAENKLAEVVADATSGLGSAGGSGDFGAEWPGYQWESSSTVTDVDLNEIRVSVSWVARGRERSIALTTYAYLGGGLNSAADDGSGETDGGGASGGGSMSGGGTAPGGAP